MTVKRLMNEIEQKIRAKEVFTVVDANGEIRDDVKVITPQMQEASKKRKELKTYKNRADNPFTLVSMEASKEVTALEELNTKELGYFLILQSYVDYSNMLKKTSDANLPMTEKELGHALKIKNKKHYSKVINKFIEIGLMNQKSVTHYGKEYQAFFIDNKYCLRGSTKSDKVVKMFIGSLQELYSQEDIKPADIGFLFMLLPYMHFQTNHLVKHPYERDFAKAEALSQKDIIEITGLDEKNVKKYLKMKLSGVNVFGTFRAGRNSVYKVNPSLFFRGVEPDEKLKADFTLTGQSL
ncbi:hypothetical protein QNH39_18835 [Neobacillus novalis]|uniref:Uncharacterized protein n=1 Tax=Neobacillus novalis TaxID=220687 RepID=A0AA95MK87_9BACI|nr:hypothetical protein [Neobacillus novalis]WHY84692.1 hypothetical protein QNH39_18835 [Neobacillus novalis]